MRRPAAVCAAGFTAGIAVCEEAGGYSFLLSAAGFLLLFLLNKCKNIEKNKINVIREGEKIPDGAIGVQDVRAFQAGFSLFLSSDEEDSGRISAFFRGGKS